MWITRTAGTKGAVARCSPGVTPGHLCATALRERRFFADGDELPAHGVPPSVAVDPDAVDHQSPEEGWRTEDEQRRGGSALGTAWVHHRRAAGAAPPARQPRTRRVACRRAGWPHHAVAFRACGFGAWASDPRQPGRGKVARMG